MTHKYINLSGLFLMAILVCSCGSLEVSTPLSKADAIVVPAGSSKERLPAAAMLYRDGYAPLVVLANDGVFSRWSKIYQRNLYHVEWAEEDLVLLGVPRDKIIKLPFYGSATIFDAIAVKKYLLSKGLSRIIIVTSDYHTRRAHLSFKKALDTFPVEIGVFSAKSFGVGAMDMFYEYLKLAYYICKYNMMGLLPDADVIPLKGSK